MKALQWVFGGGVVIYLVLGAVVFIFQRSLLYPIPQAHRTAPAAAEFPQAKEVILDTSDGEKVIAWHVAPKPGKPVVLFFHGNGEVLAWNVPRFRSIVSDGTGLVALSFRGYGGSSGKPTERGLLNDGAAAYNFAASRYAAERLVLWGYSLGTGVAVALAAEHPVGAVILEAPYTSIADAAASAFPILPARWFVLDKFRSDQRIAALKAPLLVMHGEQDSVVPIELGKRLFELAPEPKRFVTFPAGGHVNLFELGAVETVRDFLSNVTIQARKE